MPKVSTARHRRFWAEQNIANAKLTWVVGLLAILFGGLFSAINFVRFWNAGFNESWVVLWYAAAVVLLFVMFFPGLILKRLLRNEESLSARKINFWCYFQIISGGAALYLFSVVGFSERGTLIPFAAFIIFVNLFFTFKLRPKLVFNFLAFLLLGICLSYFPINGLDRIAYLVEALGFAIPAFLISYYQYQLKKDNFTQRLQLEKQNEAIKTNNSQLMMQALQTQMNPHFIFNTLNTIQHYLIENDQKASLNTMAKFAGLIRMIFHFSDKQSISLDNEIKFLQLYLDLEKLRFEDKVNISFEVSEDLKQVEGSNYVIPPLIIQPLIENAFKHSLMFLESDGNLRVNLYKTSRGHLGVDVENNGPNWGEEPPSTFLDKDKGAGQALQLIQERLAVYDKLHPLDMVSTIEILPARSYQSGSLIRLELPFAVN